MYVSESFCTLSCPTKKNSNKYHTRMSRGGPCWATEGWTSVSAWGQWAQDSGVSVWVLLYSNRQGVGWVGGRSGYEGVGLPPCFSELCSRKPLRRDDGTPLPGCPEWCRKRQPSGFKHIHRPPVRSHPHAHTHTYQPSPCYMVVWLGFRASVWAPSFTEKVLVLTMLRSWNRNH